MNRLIPFILLASIIFVSCHHSGIVGEWKRTKGSDLSDSSYSGWGDIKINSDSTFSMGDPNAGIFTDSVPGWHAAGNMRGNWRIKNGELLLRPEGVEVDYWTRYKIIALTKSKMILLPTPAYTPNDTVYYVRK